MGLYIQIGHPIQAEETRFDINKKTNIPNSAFCSSTNLIVVNEGKKTLAEYMWNMKMTVMSVVIKTLAIVLKRLGKRLQVLEITGNIGAIQKMVLLKQLGY